MPFVGNFVRQNVFPLVFWKAGRQINRRPEEPQQKRRVDPVAKPHAGRTLNGRADAAADFQKAHQRQNQQHQHANCPNHPRDVHPDLQGVDASLRIGRKVFAEDGIDGAVETCDAARELRLCRVLRRFVIENRLARNETPRTFDRHRQRQTKPRKQPDKKPRPLWRFRK